MQLKHQNETVTRNHLAAQSGDFSLQTYFKSYKNMKKIYQQIDLNCYLYTNAACKLSDKGTIKSYDGKKHIDVLVRQINLPDNDLFNTSFNKFVYKFEVSEKSGNDPEIGDYKEFFKHFFFYCNQKNVDEMKSYAWNLFKKEYFYQKSSFEKYMDFIREWSKFEGEEKYCLNKKIVSLKIGECSLRSLAIDVPLSSETNSNFVVLHQAFLHFDAIILQTTDEELIRNLAEIFGQISDVDENVVSKIVRMFLIDTDKNISFNKLDEYQKVTVLWYMNKLPLILQVNGNKNILKYAEKFCQRRKFIFIDGQHLDRSDCQRLHIFQNLKNLPNGSPLYKKIVQETKIYLQGREVTSLEDLIRNYEEIKEAFTPLELMKITGGYLRIGEDKEKLPHPYINQFLPKYVIDFKFLEENYSKSLSVINANYKLDIIKEKISGFKIVTVKEFLKEEVQSEEVEETNEIFPNINKTFDKDKEQMKHLERFVLVAEDRCSLEDFRRICDKSPNKSCHHFCINTDNNLELISSNGNIEDLKKYKSVSNDIPESEIFASSNSKINLITAKPGMGKTVLLKYLKNNIPTNYWVVNISLREHFLFFKEEHSSSEILNYCLEDQAMKMKYSDFAIKIRNIFQSKKNIAFLWDGLDELPNDCFNEVLKAIKYSSDLAFVNWITARENLQSMLEEKLKVFALTIKEMEQKEQKSYIKERLGEKYTDEAKLEKFTEKIMEAIARNDGISFLGIAFHINILTELFLCDAEKYNNLLDSTFTVADMMEHSVEERFKSYYKNKCKYEDNNLGLGKILKDYRKIRISQYESVALKTLLSTEDIVDKLPHINCQLHLTNLSEDDFGIIVGINDDRAIFSHNIYGEYFVASWMNKNLKLVEDFREDFKRFFFKEAYNNIRLLFDVIIAKGFPAHLAVLHNDVSSLRKNCNEIEWKDKMGRTPLHLACSWGEKRPILPLEKKEDLYLIDDSEAKTAKEDNLQYKEILNFLIEERQCGPFEKDCLFSWDCVEYATNSLCLLAIEVIDGHQNLKLNSLQTFNDCNIWYYGIRFGYMNLLKKMKTVPYIELQSNRNNLLHEAVSHRREEYLEKLFTNPIYLKHINKKNNNRQFVSRTKSATSVFPELPESVASMATRKLGLECIEEDNAFNVYRVLKIAPLHIAAIGGNSKAIKILLERGADINIVNNCRENALHLATTHQYLDIVKLLIENGALINEIGVWGENILHIAAQNGNCQLIEYILEQNVPLTQYTKFNTNPIHHVVLGNHIDALQIILKRIPEDKRQSLVLNPFLYAIKEGQTEMVKCFVQNGKDIVNATYLNTKMTPLCCAAAWGRLEIASFLIENKANINVGDHNGLTPLHVAVENGHTKVIQLLVEKGAHVNKTCKQGRAPLHCAAYFGQLEAAQILIKNNANINLLNKFGETPLFTAVRRNELRITEMLLKAGADVNQTDKDGDYSVLMASILLKHKEIYEFLIKNCKKYRLNIQFKNYTGVDALFIAMHQKDQHATKLLLENGASITDKFDSCDQIVNIQLLKLLIKVKRPTETWKLDSNLRLDLEE